MDKKISRLKRSAKTRHLIKKRGVVRLTVHKTPKHIYAQILSTDGGKVLACANTLQKSVNENLVHTGNIHAAKAVGKCLAERAISAGIENVAFDRSGFMYHGRIKALADSAREAGLKF